VSLRLGVKGSVRLIFLIGSVLHKFRWAGVRIVSGYRSLIESTPTLDAPSPYGGAT
jgi:hypothetical protein